MQQQDRARPDLLDTLLDIRTVFDPQAALTLTVKEALDGVQRPLAVSWVALPDPHGGWSSSRSSDIALPGSNA